jgi:hypothetical protein
MLAVVPRSLSCTQEYTGVSQATRTHTCVCTCMQVLGMAGSDSLAILHPAPSLALKEH